MLVLLPNVFSATLDQVKDNAIFLSAKRDGEMLDVNKINSSVDAGSFYSIDVGIKLLEDNMVKMTQALGRLKQQVELAKQVEQKRIEQVQKLEKENAKLCKMLLDKSLDNSLTGSSNKFEHENGTTDADLKSDSENLLTSAPLIIENKNMSSQHEKIEAVEKLELNDHTVRQDIVVQLVATGT